MLGARDPAFGHLLSDIAMLRCAFDARVCKVDVDKF